MLALTAELHPVGARADCLGEGRIQVEPGSQLVEVSDPQAGPQAHGAFVRRKFAEHEPDQGRFSRAIGADEPNTIPAHDPHREILDEWASRKAFAYPLELGHQVTRAVTGIETESNVADPVAPHGSLHAQL